jgi:hypothetical protein
MSTGKPAPISLAETDAICLKCHDGKLASAEPHPTRRIFKASDQFARPDGWPLVNEEIRCVTCHQTEFACDLKSHTRAMNRNFLRGPAHATGQEFCLNCHQEPAYRKINPHQTVNNGGEADSQCLVCHTKVLNRATTQPTGEAFLKADQVTLCRDCHPRHKDTTTENHIGLHLTREQLAFMFAKDTLGLASNPSKQILANAQNSGKRSTLLIPARDDTITCSTCHNPHEQGLFPKDSVMDYAALRLDAQNKLVSPVRDTNWCRHCHAM